MTKEQRQIDSWLKSHGNMKFRLDMFPETACHYLITYENGDTYESQVVGPTSGWHTEIKINGVIWQA